MSRFVGLEKFSLVDYDGKLACTLFIEGCNFKCPFCHNSNLAQSTNNIEIPFNTILSFLKERVGKLEGVVISGGEPTLMVDLPLKINEIKKLGFLVKLDTNGYKPEVLSYLIKNNLVDSYYNFFLNLYRDIEHYQKHELLALSYLAAV